MKLVLRPAKPVQALSQRFSGMLSGFHVIGSEQGSRLKKSWKSILDFTAKEHAGLLPGSEPHRQGLHTISQ